MKNKVPNSQNTTKQATRKAVSNIAKKTNNDNANSDMSVNQTTFQTGVVVSLAAVDKYPQPEDNRSTSGDWITVDNHEYSNRGSDLNAGYLRKSFSGHLIESINQKGIDYYCKGASEAVDNTSMEENNASIEMEDDKEVQEGRGLKRIRMLEVPIVVDI